MVPKKGTVVRNCPANNRFDCSRTIADALNGELGTGAQAAKTIMRWTGVSGRAAKYWLAGSRCPNGWQLILLARNSDAVLRAFLSMANRDLFEVSLELAAAQSTLARASAMLDSLRPE